MLPKPYLPPRSTSCCGLKQLVSCCYTLYLFTHSDIITTLIPVVLFGTMAARAEAKHLIVVRTIWVWCNLLQADVANQSLYPDEDKINKPWRPIPDGRIGKTHARVLRWSLLPVCLALSVLVQVPTMGATLAIVIICYNEFGLASRWHTRNLLNAIAYNCFNAGASSVMRSLPLSPRVLSTYLINTLLIFTTIHAQDFRDIEGDSASGRVTLPIANPSGSRASMVVLLPGWSIAIAVLSGIQPAAFVGLVLLGASVGAIFYTNSSQRCARDKLGYHAYNLWLCGVFIALFYYHDM